MTGKNRGFRQFEEFSHFCKKANIVRILPDTEPNRPIYRHGCSKRREMEPPSEFEDDETLNQLIGLSNVKRWFAQKQVFLSDWRYARCCKEGNSIAAK